MSIHSTIQRYITYVHMVKQSIYETIRPEHPHLIIRHYQWGPQGTVSRFRYIWHEWYGVCIYHVKTIIYRFTVTLKAFNPLPQISVSWWFSTTTKRKFQHWNKKQSRSIIKIVLILLLYVSTYLIRNKNTHTNINKKLSYTVLFLIFPLTNNHWYMKNHDDDDADGGGVFSASLE